MCLSASISVQQGCQTVMAEVAPLCKDRSNSCGCAGVYVGCMYHEYIEVMSGLGSQIPPQAFIGNGPPYMVGRLSYVFGLTGPCISTDTACSSSLVAAHLAVQGLETAETSSALVGGINLMLRPETTAGICQLQALSSVGRCRCAT